MHKQKKNWHRYGEKTAPNKICYSMSNEGKKMAKQNNNDNNIKSASTGKKMLELNSLVQSKASISQQPVVFTLVYI